MKELLKISLVKKLLKKVRLISGKFFDEKDNEIKNIEKWITQIAYNVNGTIIMANDVNNIVDTLLNFGDAGEWPQLPLVKKALKLGPCNDPLPFDLEEKQLIIINRMIFHPLDEVMFITTGVGGSGKSTFLNIVKQLFNNDYSAASLSDLSNSFTVAEAVKHRLICSTELAKGEINLPILKQLVSKEPLFVAPKHQQGYEVKTQSALLYCCNKAPKIDTTDTGILRRIVFYERNTKIKNPDVSLNRKVFNDNELLCILRNSLRYERDNWFEEFEEETHRQIMKDNSVYLNMHCNTYECYRDCCYHMGLRPYSQPNWKEIKELFDFWIKQSFYNNVKSFEIEV